MNRFRSWNLGRSLTISTFDREKIVPRVAERKGSKLVAAAAAAGLVLTPAIATSMPVKTHAPAVSLSFDPVYSFTPANADPKLAAALSGKSLALTDFKFTPAAAKGRPSQVRVAIRARSFAPARLAEGSAPVSAMNQLNPTGYNLGVAVGWRRFAVAGDVTQAKNADPALGGRESAVIGVSYSLSNRLSTRVAVGAERTSGNPLPALRRGDNVSLDAGASFSLSRRIALTGGVRYNIERDRLSALQDQRRDSQAVYVGTAFKF
jgi:hypothetical protein